VTKTYHVTVKDYSDEKLENLKQPVTLDGYTIRKPDVRLLRLDGDKAWLEVAIHEGRNRQVRRMCAMAGMAVVRLVRVAEGALKLGNLQRGTWRYLTEEEIAEL
jgi:23S rRNA pseudouridine2605 synthase